jgi:alpha-galactosidase
MRKIGGYETWYNRYTNINESVVLRDLEALGKTENLIKLLFLDKKRPAVFQIDDGWERRVGDWEVDEAKFPRGMRFLAERIESAGLIPGLWIAPFIVTKRSKVFEERREWVLKDRQGRPVVAGFNHLWDGRYFCLDLSREDVLAYIQGLIERVIGWGFRYIKVDFLYAGFFDGAFTGGGSPGEKSPYLQYDRACALITDRTKTASGLPVAYLGCGLPLGASFRHFPLSRVGADTREEWDWNLVKLLGHIGRPSAYVSLLDTIGRAFFDNTLYCGDPDVVFLRSKNCRLSEPEKELIALVNFLLAGQIMAADDPDGLSEDDLRFARRIADLYERLAGEECGAEREARDVFRLFSRSGRVNGVLNLSNRPYRLSALPPGEPLVSRIADNACPPHTISLFYAPS